MTDLLAKLQSATEGGRELSDDVLKALGWIPGGRDSWKAPSGKWYWPHGDQRPDPTRNLQDAVSLVPEGMEFDITNLYGPARVAMGLNVGEEGPWYADRADGNLCLALCIAIIKAHEARSEAA